MNSLNNLTINFYAKLKDKRSSVILQEVMNFISNSFSELLNNVGEMSEISIALQDFISKLVYEFANTWSIDFRNNKYAYQEICEGFESLITKSLYNQIMEYFVDDLQLQKLLKKYSFITLKHLGIEFNVDVFELANQIKSISYLFLFLDFNEISQYKSPKEKLNVVVNFCNYICWKYKLTGKVSILKIIVFSILKANVTNLKGNLRFIALFRHKTVINSEEDYFLSILFQAVEFIERLHSNLSHLKINKEEFAQFCDEFDKNELLKNFHNKNAEENMINILNKQYSDNDIQFFKYNKGPILENVNDGLLNLNIAKLHNEYCSFNLNEIPLSKFENMYNDFKIILKMVESVKSESSNGESGSHTSVNHNTSNNLSGSTKGNLIDY